MTKRIYFWKKGLVFDYRRRATSFQNKHFNSDNWYIEETWSFRAAFEKAWWEKHDFYYDGHTVKGFTLLGITVTLGYSYDSRPLVDWPTDEMGFKK